MGRIGNSVQIRNGPATVISLALSKTIHCRQSDGKEREGCFGCKSGDLPADGHHALRVKER